MVFVRHGFMGHFGNHAGIIVDIFVQMIHGFQIPKTIIHKKEGLQFQQQTRSKQGIHLQFGSKCINQTCKPFAYGFSTINVIADDDIRSFSAAKTC